MGRRRAGALRFEQRLVLNQWMLGLFGVEDFEGLADEEIKDPRYEEWDANNVAGIHHLLAGRFHDLPGRTGGPSVDDLLRYDGNIVRHTARIGAKREDRIRWKYFQYLSLLFAEVFLDRYFADPEGLLDALNEHVRRFNEGKGEAERVPDYVPDDLRKLAFWMATGGGKTLLMHLNYRQFLHYGKQPPDNILLITPNAGLTDQHLEEMRLSGIPCERFTAGETGLGLAENVVRVIEITKLTRNKKAPLCQAAAAVTATRSVCSCL